MGKRGAGDGCPSFICLSLSVIHVKNGISKSSITLFFGERVLENKKVKSVFGMTLLETLQLTTKLTFAVRQRSFGRALKLCTTTPVTKKACRKIPTSKRLECVLYMAR